VEGRDEAATVEKGGVQRGLDLRLVSMAGFGAVFQRPGGTDELDPSADADDVPRGLVTRDHRGLTVREPFGELFHVGVVLGRHHLAQGGLEAGELHGVCRERRSHAGMA